MTEQDRNHRERSLTSDSMTSDKGRSRSFTEADKNVEGTSLKKITVSAHSSQRAAAPDETATAGKKVVVVGKCRNVDSVNIAGLFTNDNDNVKGELINMARARDKQKLYILELNKVTLISRSYRNSLDRAPVRCSGGHGFNSCPGLRFFSFFCPMLVSC